MQNRIILKARFIIPVCVLMKRKNAYPNKVLTAILTELFLVLNPVLLLGQSEEVQVRKYLNFGVGYSQLRMFDRSATQLIYSSNSIPIFGGYTNLTDKSVFMANISLEPGLVGSAGKFKDCKVLSMSACDKMLLGPDAENTPVNNYDIFCKDIKERYGPFCVKDINWDSLTVAYRSAIVTENSEQALYLAIKSLMVHLNDNHVSLVTTNPEYPFFQSGIVGRLVTFTDFSLPVIENNYLLSKTDFASGLMYGKLDNNLGYIYMSHVAAGIGNFEKFLDEALETLKETDGIIIDLRNNSGGHEDEAVYIVGRFTEKEYEADKFRLKVGPGENDYSPFYSYWIEPKGKNPYLNKVVVLTHRFTISAAETLTMGFKRLERAVTIGDTTSGAFSDMVTRELPNGWVYSISIGDWRDYRGISYEGIGYPPDITIQNRAEDIASGFDEALERAIFEITGDI
ncbi:MAG: S41 family peptidase [Bacteroidales bacterium]|nr:S41 family peptidase [Bacteroidales bacterium]